MTPEESAFRGTSSGRSATGRWIRTIRRTRLVRDPALDLEDPRRSAEQQHRVVAVEHERPLLSGFRGAGKSTELRRQRRDLTGAGYLVLLFDVGDYLSPSSPIDISDFVIVVAGALSDELDAAAVLPRSAPSTRGTGRACRT
jgi:hypothetical protein